MNIQNTNSKNVKMYDENELKTSQFLYKQQINQKNGNKSMTNELSKDPNQSIQIPLTMRSCNSTDRIDKHTIGTPSDTQTKLISHLNALKSGNPSPEFQELLNNMKEAVTGNVFLPETINNLEMAANFLKQISANSIITISTPKIQKSNGRLKLKQNTNITQSNKSTNQHDIYCQNLQQIQTAIKELQSENRKSDFSELTDLIDKEINNTNQGAQSSLKDFIEHITQIKRLQDTQIAKDNDKERPITLEEAKAIALLWKKDKITFGEKLKAAFAWFDVFNLFGFQECKRRIETTINNNYKRMQAVENFKIFMSIVAEKINMNTIPIIAKTFTPKQEEKIDKEIKAINPTQYSQIEANKTVEFNTRIQNNEEAQQIAEEVKQVDKAQIERFQNAVKIKKIDFKQIKQQYENKNFFELINDESWCQANGVIYKKDKDNEHWEKDGVTIYSIKHYDTNPTIISIEKVHDNKIHPLIELFGTEELQEKTKNCIYNIDSVSPWQIAELSIPKEMQEIKQLAVYVKSIQNQYYEATDYKSKNELKLLFDQYLDELIDCFNVLANTTNNHNMASWNSVINAALERCIPYGSRFISYKGRYDYSQTTWLIDYIGSFRTIADELKNISIDKSLDQYLENRLNNINYEDQTGSRYRLQNQTSNNYETRMQDVQYEYKKSGEKIFQNCEIHQYYSTLHTAHSVNELFNGYIQDDLEQTKQEFNKIPGWSMKQCLDNISNNRLITDLADIEIESNSTSCQSINELKNLLSNFKNPSNITKDDLTKLENFLFDKTTTLPSLNEKLIQALINDRPFLEAMRLPELIDQQLSSDEDKVRFYLKYNFEHIKCNTERLLELQQKEQKLNNLITAYNDICNEIQNEIKLESLVKKIKVLCSHYQTNQTILGPNPSDADIIKLLTKVTEEDVAEIHMQAKQLYND